MRNAFAKELTLLAEKHPELVLLTGDMGNRLFNEYKQKFPDRFYNCGVAEANMQSVAAGMAMCGLRPVTYSIASFNTLRCFEQIKIDVCYHNLPVIIVGVGSGLSYAELGPTHQSCEDIAMLRTLPGMTVIAPGDAVEVKFALKAAVEWGKPVYLRLGKKNEPVVHDTDPDFTIGKAITIKKGKDICLLSTGNVLPLALDTANLLENKGKSVTVVSMHTIKPLDEHALENAFLNYSCVATIEEHSLRGGLGSAVAEWLIDQNRTYPAKLTRFGCKDVFLHASGGQNNIRTLFNIDPESIAQSL
ncbi:transketolase family protein [Desulfobacula phenolica]|uniref:Transketolase n=1 Tax=Desulfobacula phenolica TaxID=90732 RepID=A0A1H2DS68_9BACT|nr:transketolase C-terminal domain-containing protein [Desulfobacula phenolica]SDT85611.1 transketolase [Desulfobacula phenolica]